MTKGPWEHHGLFHWTLLPSDFFSSWKMTLYYKDFLSSLNNYQISNSILHMSKSIYWIFPKTVLWSFTNRLAFLDSFNYLTRVIPDPTHHKKFVIYLVICKAYICIIIIWSSYRILTESVYYIAEHGSHYEEKFSESPEEKY